MNLAVHLHQVSCSAVFACAVVATDLVHTVVPPASCIAIDVVQVHLGTALLSITGFVLR